jgi:antitoxin HigA-1
VGEKGGVELMAAMKRELDPLPNHPGQEILYALQKKFPSQTTAAREMGISDSYLSDVLRGLRPLSARMALDLEAVGVGDAEGWLLLQVRWDLRKARSEARTKKARRQ